MSGEVLDRLALVTDAWQPQTNGVVNTLSRLVGHLESEGTEVLVIAPHAHRTVPLPSYPEIRVACDPWKAIARLRAFAPDAVHIATEGPLGSVDPRLAGPPRAALHHQLPHAVSRVPERAAARAAGLGLRAGALVPRRRPAHAGRHAVADAGAEARAWAAGWCTGRAASTPRRSRPSIAGRTTFPYPRPIWLYVGRVAVEKSIEEFLALPLPGTKVVVGDGPFAGRAAARVPRGRLARLALRRGAGRTLRERRLLRVPVAHGDVRQRASWRRWPRGCRWRRCPRRGRPTSSRTA